MATNTLLPLTETLGGMGTIKDRFFSAVMDYYTYQGDVYGIPLHNNTPGIGFITNLDLWQEAGMDPPLTYTHWNDVWQDAKSLTQADDDGIINVAGLSMRNYHNIQYLCGAIYEQGGTYLNEETGEWSVNTPEGIRALTELFHDPIFTHEVDSPDLPAVFNGLAEGRMAMGGIWIDYIPFAATAFPEGNFGFTMRPGIRTAPTPSSSGEGGWGLNVNAASEKSGGRARLHRLPQRRWRHDPVAPVAAFAALRLSRCSTMNGTPATKPSSCSRPWRPCRTGSGSGRSAPSMRWMMSSGPGWKSFPSAPSVSKIWPPVSTKT